MYQVSKARPHLRSRVIVRSSEIYMPYFQMYTQAICENVPERARELCVLGMRIPDYQQQQAIVDKMLELRDGVDLGSADGAAMILLLKQQDETLEMLIQALIMYHTSLDMIRQIVTDTMEMAVPLV